MGEVMRLEPSGEGPKLFNSHLEVGLRVIVILDAFFPRRLDISEIALFDYFVVHTGDIGGPSSLHPDIASRTGEYLVRRKTIEDGINLMHQIHLIELNNEETGLLFQASEAARSLLDLMGTPYSERLKQCAFWMAEMSEALPSGSFEDNLRQVINNSTLQFGMSSKNKGVN